MLISGGVCLEQAMGSWENGRIRLRSKEGRVKVDEIKRILPRKAIIDETGNAELED